MNIRMVWLKTEDQHLPPEHIVYLDHVPGMGEENLCGYIVREKSQGRYQPVEILLTKVPMPYWQALKFWKAQVRKLLEQHGYQLTSDAYRLQHFTMGWELPPLSDPLLEHLSAPMREVHTYTPPKPPPRPQPAPAPEPITLPPYNPSPIKFNTPHEPRAVSKPKRKPARRFPVNTGRRITLED